MTQKTYLYRIHLYWTQMQHGASGRPNRKTTALCLSKAKLGSVNNYSAFESSLWLATAVDWMPDNGWPSDYVTWTSHNDLGVIYRTTKSHIHRISFVLRRKLYMKDWAQNDQEGTDELHKEITQISIVPVHTAFQSLFLSLFLWPHAVFPMTN